MGKRQRPKIEDMESQVDHSYEHRGETGKFGNIYKPDSEVSVWRCEEGEHELCLIPYLVEENSVFRTSNPDFNPPFKDSQISAGKSWSYKLSVLIHYNVGINKDAVLCLCTLRQKCPICERRDELIETKEEVEGRKEAEALDARIRNLSPSKKCLYNIFCFDSDKEMDKGVQLWEAPHASIEDIIAGKKKDRRTGELRPFWVPEEGWDVFFEKKGKVFPNIDYVDVDIVERRKEDDFKDSELDELYDLAWNLEDIIVVPSHKEVKAMMGEEVVEEEETEKEEEQEERATGRFRGRKSRKEEPEKEEEEQEEPEKEEELTCPVDQFGQGDNKLPECEDCPDDLWTSCQKACEENKKKQQERTTTRRGRRGGRRK